MRLRRQLPDQLVGKAHADFHGVHVRPGEVFVVVTPAAAATGRPAAVNAVPGTITRSISDGSHVCASGPG